MRASVVAGVDFDQNEYFEVKCTSLQKTRKILRQFYVGLRRFYVTSTWGSIQCFRVSQWVKSILYACAGRKKTWCACVCMKSIVKTWSRWWRVREIKRIFSLENEKVIPIFGWEPRREIKSNELLLLQCTTLICSHKRDNMRVKEFTEKNKYSAVTGNYGNTFNFQNGIAIAFLSFLVIFDASSITTSRNGSVTTDFFLRWALSPTCHRVWVSKKS